MILRRGEEREAWRKFHGAELNEKRKSLEEKHTITRKSREQTKFLDGYFVLSVRFDSLRFHPLLERSTPSRKKRERETTRREREREREDGSLKSLVRFIYREKERRLSGDRFIEQRPVSGSASD